MRHFLFLWPTIGWNVKFGSCQICAAENARDFLPEARVSLASCVDAVKEARQPNKLAGASFCWRWDSLHLSRKAHPDDPPAAYANNQSIRNRDHGIRIADFLTVGSDGDAALLDEPAGFVAGIC